jgi:crotonobetainyl-CoA:carnitine CoA-transferase CaiB-like acyl-CoA transferase
VNRDALQIALEERLAARAAAEWAELLTAARVPAGVVNDIGAAFALAERLELEPIVAIERDDGTVARLPRNPIGLSLTPPTYRLPPPDPPLR